MTITLDLNDHAPWAKLSAGSRLALTEAAAVMLTSHHAAGTCNGIWNHGGNPLPQRVTWSLPNQISQASHGNAKDATEHGAYAIAIHAAAHLGWRVCGRLQQGSGADWWLLDPNEGKAVKLEVSGINEGGSPETRFKQKIAQAKGGVTSPGWGGMAFVFRFQDVSSWSEVW